MRIMFSIIGICIFVFTLNAAYETTPDGLTWKYEIEDGKAIIVCREDTIKTGSYPYEKFVTEYTASISSDTVGTVIIPETLGGCPVVSIGHDAFKNCKKITSLLMPHTITNIGTWTWSGDEPRKGGAFGGCTGLTEIHIDDLSMMYKGIKFQNIADNPFCDSRNANLYVGGALITEVVIDDECTDINDYSFYGWGGLSQITFSQGVTNIGKYAFYSCKGLREIKLPANLKAVGEAAFAGCENISSISIPPCVETIGEDAFGGCGRHNGLSLELFKFEYGREISKIVSESYVTSLVFAANVEVLPYSVSTFTNLVRLTIPPSIKFISSGTFDKCTRLKTEWTKTICNLSAQGISIGVQYDLSDCVADRSIASVVVNEDSAIDEFVLVDGKVYDAAIRIVNTAASAVRITLPKGFVYESFLGAAPLILPAKSTNMLTITRTGNETFLVARRQLQTIAR